MHGSYKGRWLQTAMSLALSLGLVGALKPMAAAQAEQNSSQEQTAPEKPGQSGEQKGSQEKRQQDQPAAKPDQAGEKPQPPAEKQTSPEQGASGADKPASSGQEPTPLPQLATPQQGAASEAAPTQSAPQQMPASPTAPSTGQSVPTAPGNAGQNLPPQPNGQPLPSVNAAPAKNGAVAPRRKIVVREGGTGDSNAMLAPSMTPEQAARQKEKTLHMLASADVNLQRISGRQLNSNQQAMVEQARAYMRQSKEALNRGDLQRSHNLALKASLLTDDLARH
jgi:hypothetical protein